MRRRMNRHQAVRQIRAPSRQSHRRRWKHPGHSAISYGVPGPRLIGEIFQGIRHNLVIKTPKHTYQREYRIIGAQPVECHLRPDAKHPGCKTEEIGLLLQQNPWYKGIEN